MYAHIYEVYVRGMLWRRTTHLLLKCQYAFEARCRKQKDAEDYRTASSANAKKQQRECALGGRPRAGLLEASGTLTPEPHSTFEYRAY